jgi:transcription antitermination factor NusG
MADHNNGSNAGRWFVLRVKPNHEKRLFEVMHFMGHESFLPLYRVRQRQRQRWQDIDKPLFPGYVFCRFDRTSWVRIMNAPGVVDVIRIGKALAPVEDEEIEALQVAQKAKADMQPWPYLRIGQTIRVDAGPLAGVRGILSQVKGQRRLVLSVTLLQRSVLVEIDQDWVTYDPIMLRAEL